jgi:3-methyladenine DNA glycosylase/8-oxoguanine DNA glycosylase
MVKKVVKAKSWDVDSIKTPDEAAQYLAHKFPEIRKIYDKYGPCELSWRKDRSTHFAALVETICYQQLAGKAAATIHGRVLSVLNKATPENMLLAKDEDLRGAGLSGNKLLSMRSLTEHVIESKIDLKNAWRHDDESVIEQLVQIRGIGRWSAQMFLIDRLKRLDVWPAGDYGVRAGAKHLFKLKKIPGEKAAINIADKYKPFRSVIAWYCWRLADDKEL